MLDTDIFVMKMNTMSISYYDMITLQMYYNKTINAHKDQSDMCKKHM